MDGPKILLILGIVVQHCSTKTAAGLKERAGDPAGVVGGDEGDDVSDVFRLAGATERGVRDRVVFEVRARDSRRLNAFGDGQARVYGVDANLFGAEFLGKDAGDGVDCTLGPGVDGRIGGRQLADDRADVDNASAFGREEFYRCFGGEQKAGDVGGVDTVDLFFGDV